MRWEGTVEAILKAACHQFLLLEGITSPTQVGPHLESCREPTCQPPVFMSLQLLHSTAAAV